MDPHNCSCNVSINCSVSCGEEEAYGNYETIFYTPEQIHILHALYVLVLATGIGGNLLTCTVILLRPTMRRSIHYYTFNLSICDLLILLFYVPTQMVYIKDQLTWFMGITMCKIAYVVLPVSLISTIGTLLAITIDRTRGLVQPFKWRSDSQRHAKIALPMIWMIAIVLNIPLFIIAKVTDIAVDVPICTEEWPKDDLGTVYWIFMFGLVFVIPLIIITVAHVVMLVVMSKDESQKHRKTNKRMIRMVFALVIVFTVCTGYQHVNFFINVYGNIDGDSPTYGLLYATSNFVVSLQACLNPIIYGTLRQDFNRAFGTLFHKLMVKLKLQKEKRRFSLNRRFTSFRSTRNTMRSRGSTSRNSSTHGFTTSTDSPIASPRDSHVMPELNFHQEPKLVLLRQNSDIDDAIPILRKNLALRYKHSLPTTPEENENLLFSDSLDVPSLRSDSPISPRFITDIASRKKSVFHVEMNNRFSRIIEYLNDSPETYL